MQFDYEEIDAAVAKPASPSDSTMARSSMKGTSVAQRVQLRQAAIELDSDSASAIIQQLRSHDSALADGLAAYVRAFRFDSILHLLDYAEE